MRWVVAQIRVGSQLHAATPASDVLASDAISLLEPFEADALIGDQGVPKPSALVKLDRAGSQALRNRSKRLDKLILDESTGALDPVTEAEVLDRLLVNRQGKTTIMISHRPRLIQRADWTVLLDQREVKQTGTPEAFSQLPGEHLNFLNP